MPDPIVIVGGGLAAGTAVTELREGGYDGDVVLFADEAHPPYERPPLSKDILLGKGEPKDALVHEEGWYADHGVDMRTGSSVTRIDPAARTVTAGSDEVAYDALLLATGARARTLPLADDSDAEVTYLRTLDDSVRLKERLTKGTRVAIIGGGWIGLEVASAARNADAEVTVLESLEAPLFNVLGAKVANIFADLHREHGVDLRTGVSVSGVRNGEVALAGGATVPFDLLIVGIGAVPNDSVAANAGLTVENGIRTDDHLRTSVRNVFAAGDVANADHPVLGRPVRVEHWDTAIKHGKVAAANLAGGDATADALPYFFTDQYDLGMEYVGHPGPDGYDRVILRGDVANRVFTSWWLRGSSVVAGMQVNDWDAIEQVRRIVGHDVDPAALEDETRELGDLTTS